MYFLEFSYSQYHPGINIMGVYREQAIFDT